jgi:hypothetical protein
MNSAPTYELVDLSQEIFTDARRWPGHPPTRIEYVAQHDAASKRLSHAASPPLPDDQSHLPSWCCGFDSHRPLSNIESLDEVAEAQLKEISRREFEQIFGQGRLDLIDETVAVDYVCTTQRCPTRCVGPKH